MPILAYLNAKLNLLLGGWVLVKEQNLGSSTCFTCHPQEDSQGTLPGQS